MGPNRGGATPETLQKTNYTPKKKGDFLGLVRSYSWFVTPKKKPQNVFGGRGSNITII